MVRIFALCLAAFVTTAQADEAAPAPELPRPLRDADFRPVNETEAALGQLLFYDKVISGNRNIACASCHHPRFGTGDGLALSLGEGGIGLGPDRVADPNNMPEQRVPRNAQPLFNLGAREMVHLFHDGRIEVDPARPSGLRTPLESEMPAGFDTILAAQTMFPAISPDEMAGHYGENEISVAVRKGDLTGPDGAWALIARRVSSIPAYLQMFAAADPEIAAGRPISFADVSNAIAAFMEVEWRSDDSPFDRHLSGETPLSGDALAGLSLFYGKAGCSECHSGPLLTDHQFHAAGAPQLGPGKGARFERHARDEGRMEVTGRAADAYRFRTPPLRNVAITGPWGHAGAHDDLAAFIADHAAPRNAPWPQDAVLPALPGADDFAVRDDDAERAMVLGSVARPDVTLTAGDVALLVAFLNTATGDSAKAGRLGIPQSVPSGLPVDR
ncbi:cytochrome c peroxidase [Acuticoccus sp. MNP-M23]|uniref:cytochrome-c peroxidase n=1 Tax=Acuticoccus sp. MNP-M23 TaxID=3072793 RepID=UPI002815FB7F|nr:cytochrome c peroxidase [Acuticoccus sp. MNP-M23]WMS40911.1 cytochrome c peroxidase [Acuticoccus sp. MNP-M23]